MVFKISIVIPGTADRGAIVDMDHVPAVGDRLAVGDLTVEVVEIAELLPPRGDFRFFHATCRPIEATAATK